MPRPDDLSPTIPTRTPSRGSAADPLRTGVGLPPAAPSLPAIGDRVAHYKLVKQVGMGGMGVVYQAIDGHLRRQVALKMLLPEFAADPVARTRFVREARAAAGVTHDNIVAVYHVGEHRNAPFLAMPYLAGMSLARFLAARLGQPLDVRKAVRVAREVAAGLAAAHAAGLVHRDIKPSNVWLEAPNGRVKLLDFGLAKRVQADAGLTQPGLVLGTPAYMAPEQARGEETDRRADLFSLGVVLYELLAGVNPFARPTSMDTMAAVAADPAPPLRPRNRQVSPELAKLVDKLLTKDPAARPKSAAAVGDALRAIDRAERKAAADPESAGYEVIDTTAGETAAPESEAGMAAIEAAYQKRQAGRDKGWWRWLTG